MNNEIMVCECIEMTEQERIWKYLKEYFVRDIAFGESDCLEEY